MEHRFTIGTQGGRKCAFCKNWYDPTNSNIKPVAPKIKLWAILDSQKKAMCLHYGTEKVAMLSCQHFELKL